MQVLWGIGGMVVMNATIAGILIGEEVTWDAAQR